MLPTVSRKRQDQVAKFSETMIIYVLLLSTWKFHLTMTNETQEPVDISSAFDVYASMKPLSMIQCTAQCAARPRCNSVLLEERTKTCFLNKGVATLPNLSMQGYQYSEKADMNQQSRTETCRKTVRDEYSACVENIPGLKESASETTPTNRAETTTVSEDSTSSDKTVVPTTVVTTMRKVTTSVVSKLDDTTTVSTMNKVTTVQDSTSPDTTTLSETTLSNAIPLEDSTSPDTPSSVAGSNVLTAEITTEATNLPCPSSYIADTSLTPVLCYLFVKDKTYTHQDAAHACTNHGGHLLLSVTLERYNIIKDFILKSVSSTDSGLIWLDGKRTGQFSSWRTYDDVPFIHLYQPFDTTAPDVGNCLSRKLSGGTLSDWQPTNCSLRGWFVCVPT